MYTAKPLQLLLVAATLLGLAAIARAVEKPTGPQYIPPELRDIGIDENLGKQLPLDIVLVDENGNDAPLSKFFDGRRPVVIQLGYFGCPQLCGLVSQGMFDSLQKLTLNAGTDYQLLYISFDPAETYRLAAAKKQSILREYGRGPASADGMHLLTGNPRELKALTEAIGFRYKWIESQRQFSHPAAIMVATPDGRLSRYLYGVKFDDQTLRLSLVEGSEGKIGSTMDQILLICFMYSGSKGKYALAAMRLMQFGGAITLITVVSVMLAQLRKEARRNSGEAPGGPTPTA